MLPRDPNGKIGPKRPLPDSVRIFEPKEEELPTHPHSEQKGIPKPDEASATAVQATPQALPSGEHDL